MPLFVLMAYGLYFKTGRKSYIAGAVVMLAGYLAGFFMMCASSLTYVYGNYDRLYIGPVGPSNLKAFDSDFDIEVIRKPNNKLQVTVKKEGNTILNKQVKNGTTIKCKI